MKLKKFISYFFMAAFCISFITSCSISANQQPATREMFALDTIINLKYYGKNADKALDESVNRISDIEKKMSIFLSTSEISQINANSGKKPVRISADTFYVVEKAYQQAKLSNGAFDPTVEPLTYLWGIGTPHQKIPSQSEIDKVKPLINYHDIIMDKNTLTVELRQRSQGLDFGGIAKGYSADELKKICRKYNINSALIDLGGNVYAVGNNPDGTAWKIGVQNPLADTGQYLGIVAATDKSLVSAGDYQRFFVQNGKTYGQIFDPSTGYPSANGIIGTTILSDYSIDGDALSNSLYVLGVDKGLKLIESLKGTDALCITSDKKIYLTPGMKKVFQLTDTSYKIAN
ncbi:FAD:protein FMN transferase [Clostridium sp. WILCCON 0269]|uniref:FAD:protein FMN transferase n=1 Tax=Candidatus Clostridium eludens TaxID=3381663 RepID=A0ABW8SPR0_9CLOT